MTKDGMLRLRDDAWDAIKFGGFKIPSDFKLVCAYIEALEARDKIERPEVTALVTALVQIAGDTSDNRDFYLQHTAQEALDEYRQAVKER